MNVLDFEVDLTSLTELDRLALSCSPDTDWTIQRRYDAVCRCVRVNVRHLPESAQVAAINAFGAALRASLATGAGK